MVRWVPVLLLMLLLAACGSRGTTPTKEPPVPPPVHLSQIASRWKTDWARATISLEELASGGPGRDEIPPLDSPKFISTTVAMETLADPEPVVVFTHGEAARAYPLALLMWHEIVNDEVGGQPVTITYCPLCNSAIAFDRRLGDHLLDFGTSGLLRRSDLVMWDRQTESLWQQVTGEAIVGELAGAHLTFLPASILSFGEFRRTYPEGEVLSPDTGHRRNYGANPYQGYDSRSRPYDFFNAPVDARLPAMERVVGITLDEAAVAYPFSIVAEAVVINDEIAGQPVAIFYSPQTLSALDRSTIRASRAVGSAVAFDPVLNGERLRFEQRDGQIVDTSTGSQWEITGRAVRGSLQGSTLTVLPHANHFWFAFAAFYPNAEVRGETHEN